MSAKGYVYITALLASLVTTLMETNYSAKSLRRPSHKQLDQHFSQQQNQEVLTAIFLNFNTVFRSFQREYRFNEVPDHGNSRLTFMASVRMKLIGNN